MPMYKPPLTLGIEEEYMIIDPATRELTAGVQEMLTRGEARLGSNVKAEFMQSQLEVAGSVCANIVEARAELIRLRRGVIALAQESGKTIGAAATHPFSKWRDQYVTPNERYYELYGDMQDVARRLLIFGMHVHLGFGTSDEARALTIDIMNQIRYFLPHILALTTSSPFWHGRDTGLKSYRCVIFESLPRTGLPPSFGSYEEYERYMALLARTGSLGKGVEPNEPRRIWWDVRPNARIGTLEIRVADICTTVDEAMCVTAIIQGLAAFLIDLRAKNQSWRWYRGEQIQENKWRAQRYGIDAELIDFGIEESVPIRKLWDEILTLIDPHLDRLGAREDAYYVHQIFEHGTSADRQTAVYHAALKDGLGEADALVRVMDHILAETKKGL
jgi:glutamate---cysteine ligase / carboxylate-amine ligase